MSKRSLHRPVQDERWRRWKFCVWDQRRGRIILRGADEHYCSAQSYRIKKIIIKTNIQ